MNLKIRFIVRHISNFSLINLEMLIANVFNPLLQQGLSAEESIMANELHDFYDEIRRTILHAACMQQIKNTELSLVDESSTAWRI